MFIQCLLQILLRFGAVLSCSPNGVTLPIKTDVGGPGVNFLALNDYLKFALAHVYTEIAISLRSSDREITEGIANGTPQRAGVQWLGLFYLVEDFSGLFRIAMLDLIVDQEVVGSSPTSRPKFLSQSRK